MSHELQNEKGTLKVAGVFAKIGRTQDNCYTFNIFMQPEFGHEEEIQNIEGEILFEGSTIGILHAYLFARSLVDAGGFYNICDIPSSETQECSVLFFEDNGKLQKSFVHAHNLTSTCDSDGYLHINSVQVDEAHRGQGLGLSLMQKCLDKLADSWTITMIQPYPLNAVKGEFENAIVGMSRHFARLGFEKCDTNNASDRCKFWYLEAGNYTGQVKSKQSVQDLKVVLPLKPPALSDLSKEIREIVNETSSSVGVDVVLSASGRSTYNEATFKEKIKSMLARGGNLNESSILHVAVADSLHNHLIQPLVDLGASVNYADYAGATPLHVAAVAFNANGATILVALGADKSLKNKTGETPLQMAQAAKKSFDILFPFQHRIRETEHTVAALK